MSDFTPTLRQRFEYLGLRVVIAVVGVLPFRAVRSLANVVGAIVYVFDRQGRQVALANVEAAFGDALSSRRKRRIACGSYQTFARTMLELFWSPNLNPGTAARIASFEGLELDSCHQDPKQAVIYLCLHFSNFEWLGQFSAYAIGNGPIISQKFKNPLIEKLFAHLRSGTGNELIPQERSMIRMLKHLQSGGKFAMLCDLSLDPGESAVAIETFGGLKICITQMQAALALRTNAKIVPVECRPQEDGRYRMIYHKPLEYPPDATAGEIIQLCWNVLEPSIHAQPECWLWSYKHWRFRPSSDSSGRYPPYANVAKRFDKLLKKQNREREQK